MKIIAKAVQQLMTRPTRFYANTRMVITFYIAYAFRGFVFGAKSGVGFGKNVRLQRLGTILCEQPHAKVQIGDHSIIYEDAKLEVFGSGEILVGENCTIGPTHIMSRARVKLGRGVVTSWNVSIQDFDPHPLNAELRRAQLELATAAFIPKFDGVNLADTREEGWAGQPAGKPVDQSSAGNPSNQPSNQPDAWLSERRAKMKSWSFPCEEIIIGDDVWIGMNVTILKGARVGRGSVIAAGSVVTKGDYPENSLLGGVPAKVLKRL